MGREIKSKLETETFFNRVDNLLSRDSVKLATAVSFTYLNLKLISACYFTSYAAGEFLSETAYFITTGGP